MHVIYITNASETAATQLAERLIDENLIACGNILRSKSIYPWKGELKKEDEWVLLVKTVLEPKKVTDRIEKIHPYECPCVITLPAKANDAYESWLQKVLQ